ncbi:unnamed protein product [Linum tenue]|uniref:Uncharacterized protein n=3 Tax=Linum tenue TaxID=586396 RepID=A0AAV0NLB1_9ROSI|nr:unnamed protein product [Linum tenue]
MCRPFRNNIIVKRGEPVTVSPPQDAIEGKGVFSLSFLDHIVCWVRSIYGFKPNERGNEMAGQVFKTALSKLLVHYYPLAGRLTVVSREKLAVSCYEQGAVFVEAEADFAMQDIEEMVRRDPSKLVDLVYDDGIHGNAKPLPQCPLLVAQVTKLKCGGFVLGTCISHCIGDGFTAMEVVNSWAEIARGLSISMLPNLDKSSLLPRNPPRVEFHHPEFTKIENRSSSAFNDFSKENMVHRVFHFNREFIKELKSKAMEDGVLSKCSTFECLTTFIWIARSKALNMVGDQESKLMVPVNVREKMDPPLPKGYLGNGIAVACTISKARDLNNEPFSTTVGLVQDAIKMVTNASVRSSIDCHELHGNVHSFAHTMLATTWSRIPFCTTDFGWGDAIFMAPVALPVDEMVIFFQDNGKEHYGDMVVYVALPESTMETFQNLVMM